MRKMNWVSYVSVFGVFMLLLSGCSSFVTLNDRSMSIEDVIALSKTKMDSEVIISQIDATHSKFRLTAEDIVRLKDAEVDDDVIKYMIESDFTPPRYNWEYGYSSYDYWFNYYNAYYYPISGFGRAPYYYPHPYTGYPTPYISQRERGLVGDFYRYYPLVPPEEYEYYFRRDRENQPGMEDSEQDRSEDSED